jgi:alpha-beta hydrolase superfamily lysophospholipase/SAM-dependent methyltransferase
MSTSLQFTTEDGLALRYKTWPPASAATPTSRALVLLHRGHEHADRWDAVVPRLQLPDTAIYAWDARGHGQSPGRRGHGPGFMQYVRDLDAFMRHLASVHGVQPERTVLIAHSVGAVVGTAWAHDFAPRLAGLALVTPAFDVNLIVPGALAGIRLMQKIRRDATITSYVRGDWLTRDPAAAAAYDADPLISKAISARILVELFDAAQRVVGDAGVMDRPLLLLSAGQDRVVKAGALDRFYTNYGGEIKIHHTLPAARHGLFHDLCSDEVCALIRRFAERCFAAPTPTLLGPDLAHPHTTREYAELLRPLPTLGLRNLAFAAQRVSMRTLGRLSRGIRVGLRTGFDSGESLDYVYENRARGALLLGAAIDRGYLDAIGWRGIRQRRVCLDAALRYALAQTRARSLPARILDVAAGGGRYLLDLLADQSLGTDLRILCRDWSETALATGRAAAQARGLAERVIHERADAFDEASVAAAEPAPAIGVVSGLYELFPDNAPLQRSLRGLARALPPEGLLIYTDQPWHPQVEMIARTLTNRDGAPWIMRRRPQGEMDALVAAAGFVKERQWIDDFGIFTVSLARRLPAPAASPSS